MATGGVFSRPVQDGSDELFDFTCNSCENLNKTVEASSYCADCNMCYCTDCFKFHGSIPALKTHTVLGRNKVKSWGKQASASMATEMCSHHHGKTVEMFCGNHDLVCCQVCVSLYHRTCDDMQLIAEVAQGIADSHEFLAVKINIKRPIIWIEHTKNTRKQQKATLGKSRIDVLESIKDYRKHVHKIFDTLEKKVKDDMETFYKVNDRDIQDDIDCLDNCMAELKQRKHQLETTSAVNESQTFIDIKKAERQMQDGEQMTQMTEKSPRNDNFVFIINPELERFLASLKNLGTLEMRPTVPEVKKREKNHPYKASYIGTDYNVRIEEDKTSCFIAGSCQMADGAILLTDSTNKKLKRLDASYTVNDYCDLPGQPHTVCCIGQHEVAVTDQKKKIHFVSVDSKMTVTRSMKLKHDICGIAYNNNQLYMSNYNKVYIYNMSGTCLRTLYKDITGVEMFASAQHIAVSPDGTKIYVADQAIGLVTLDSSGQLLSIFSDSQLYDAGGVCVDMDGNVFVCGYGSHNVIQVDEKGQRKIGVVAKRGIKYPWSACIDKLQSTILVTRNIDTVRVFGLE